MNCDHLVHLIFTSTGDATEELCFNDSCARYHPGGTAPDLILDVKSTQQTSL